jgi:FkbM family methyltransferase
MTDSLIRNLNMQSIANLPIWLNMAAQVYCPDKVVLVGAGNGTGPLVQGLLGLKALPTHEHLQAHLLEADPLALSQLVKKIDPECAWILSQETVVSDQTSIDADLNTYYQYSLGSESGLLPPGYLKSLWPNIQLRKKEFCANGILLSSLLPASWLLVDCLPSVQLIKGVDLGQVEVIMARVVFDEIEKSPVGSSLIELDEKLSSQGFKLFACFTERNTSIGKALWLRDSAKQLEQSKAHGEQQAKQLFQQKSEIQQLTELKAELESKLEAEVKSRVQEVQSLKLEKDTLEQDQEIAQENLKAEINSKNALVVKTQELEQQQVEFSAKKLELEKVQEQTTQQVKELQDKLEQAIAKSEQQKAELSLLNEWKSFEDLKSRKYEISSIKSLLSVSRDDDIDDFLSDIQPFFLGKKITYVDVGACTGDVYKKIITLNKFIVREAHLIEPNKDNFDNLKLKNDALIKARHPSLYNVAILKDVSDIFITRNRSMSRIVDVSVKDEVNIIKARATTLVEIAKNITDKKIHLLKIDTEGSEMDVLEGGESLFSDGLVDIVYIEVGFNPASTQQTYFCNVENFMARFDYRLFGIYEVMHEWIDGVTLLRRCNFAYMRKAVALQNPGRLIKQILENSKNTN